MLLDYIPFLEYFSNATWKTFSYIYFYSWNLSKKDESKMYDSWFYIDANAAIQIIGISVPGFSKAIKTLNDYNLIDKKRYEKNKNFTKYKINHFSNVKFPMDEINNNTSLDEKFLLIEKELRFTKADINIKIDLKTTQQLKELLEEISDLKNYIKWFIKKKINPGRITNFNIGIFTTPSIIKEYKESWNYKKIQKVKTMARHSSEKNKLLDDEMLMMALDSLKTGRNLSFYESEVLRESISSGVVYTINKKYILLNEFLELEDFSCKIQKDVSNKNCIECWNRKRSPKYLNRIDCQILSMNWKEILIKLKSKKDKKDFNYIDNLFIKYIREINILNKNKLNEEFIKSIKEKYNADKNN